MRILFDQGTRCRSETGLQGMTSKLLRGVGGLSC